MLFDFVFVVQNCNGMKGGFYLIRLNLLFYKLNNYDEDFYYFKKIFIIYNEKYRIG